MLGADADALGNLITKNHVELKQADCRIINDIYRSVKYFGQLFETKERDCTKTRNNVKRTLMSSNTTGTEISFKTLQITNVLEIVIIINCNWKH